MNNSFARLIDGMCATLRAEVLPRLEDDFARGQVFGVINLLNTFKARADWSPGFVMQQLQAQHEALQAARAKLARQPTLPTGGEKPLPPVTSVADLVALRDENNRALADWLAWLDGPGARLPRATREEVEAVLLAAMRREIEVELKNSPRPLFAEMSSGKEG